MADSHKQLDDEASEEELTTEDVEVLPPKTKSDEDSSDEEQQPAEITYENAPTTLVESPLPESDTSVEPVSETLLDRPTETIVEFPIPQTILEEPQSSDEPIEQSLVEEPTEPQASPSNDVLTETIVEMPAPTEEELQQALVENSAGQFTETLVEFPIPKVDDSPSPPIEETLVEEPTETVTELPLEDIPTLTEVPLQDVETLVEATPADLETIAEDSLDRPTQHGLAHDDQETITEAPAADSTAPNYADQSDVETIVEDPQQPDLSTTSITDERDIPRIVQEAARFMPPTAPIREDFHIPSEIAEGDTDDDLDNDSDVIPAPTFHDEVQSQQDVDPDATIVNQDLVDELAAKENTVRLPESKSPAEANVSPRKPKPTEPKDKPQVAAPGSTESQTAKKPQNASPDRRYVLESSFGFGGMGRIYKARDERINREVAYKVLLPQALERQGLVDRFIDEAQITGQLEHPGIVPIYDLGQQGDGTPFYAMKMVQGDTLAKAIADYHHLSPDHDQRGIQFQRLLRNFIDVCNAIAYSHERGVLHCDLKPQNIMVGDFGETIVLDWGLAKVLDPEQVETDGAETRDDDTINVPEDAAFENSVSKRSTSSVSRSRTSDSATEMGSVMGTPEFMPPEQARGALSELDPRSDIYSLGAILYQILTGYPPIPRDKSVKDKLQLVIGGMIKEPRQFDQKIPKPIEAVCMKALAIRKHNRYQTAKALAADIEAFLADEPVTAMIEPFVTKAKRWAKRNRTIVTATASTAIVAAVLLTSWNIMESARIDGVVSEVESLLEESGQSIEAGEFQSARDTLQQVKAILDINQEPQLEMSRRLYSDRYKLVDETLVIEAHADELIAAADESLDEDDFDEAVRQFEAAINKLREQPRLKDRIKETERKIADAQTSWDQARQREVALERYDRFIELADQARFHGTRFTGGAAQEHAGNIYEQALRALQIFELDQQENLFVDNKYFTSSEARRIRELSFELMLILAESQTELSDTLPEQEQQDARQAALAWVDKAAQLGIKSRALYLQRAFVLDKLGDVDGSKEARELASSLSPSSAIDHFLLGEIDRKAGRFENALQSYSAVVKLDNDHFWAHNMSGVCNLQLGKLDTARQCYEMCSGLRPKFSWTYLTLAIAEAFDGNYESALKHFKTAEAYDSDSYNVFMMRGVVLSNRLGDEIADLETQESNGVITDDLQRDYDEAIRDFKKAASLDPTEYEPHFNLGETHRRMADWIAKGDGGDIAAELYLAKARVSLNHAIALAPQVAKPHEIRALVYWLQKEYALAIEDSRQAILKYRDAASKARCYKIIGGVSFDQAELLSALEAYDQSTDLNPNDAEVQAARAEVKLKLGQYVEAVQGFSRYLALNPIEFLAKEAKAEVIEARAQALARLGQFQTAMHDYNRALELKGNNPDVMLRRAWSYLNNFQKLAQIDFENATKLQPKNPETWIGLASVYAMQGHFNEAIANANKAEELVDAIPADAQGNFVWSQYFNLATIYSQLIARARIDSRLSVEQRQTIQTQSLAKAVELLKTSLGKTKNRMLVIASFNNDPAFEVIRNAPEIRLLVKPVSTPENN
ncbi:MAG: hypothetical protein CMJ78_15320 [Planctomycetaceae bacterium]|nr:hypothetical protein [Planctomycetaceae bacterium]